MRESWCHRLIWRGTGCARVTFGCAKAEVGAVVVLAPAPPNRNRGWAGGALDLHGRGLVPIALAVLVPIALAVPGRGRRAPGHEALLRRKAHAQHAQRLLAPRQPRRLRSGQYKRVLEYLSRHGIR